MSDHHLLEVLPDQRHSTKEVAARDHQRHPTNTAEHVERQKSHVMHSAHTGDKGRESPNNRHEFGINNRLAAVPLIEFVCAVEVLAPEQLRIAALEEPVTDFIAKRNP